MGGRGSYISLDDHVRWWLPAWGGDWCWPLPKRMLEKVCCPLWQERCAQKTILRRVNKTFSVTSQTQKYIPLLWSGSDFFRFCGLCMFVLGMTLTIVISVQKVEFVGKQSILSSYKGLWWIWMGLKGSDSWHRRCPIPFIPSSYLALVWWVDQCTCNYWQGSSVLLWGGGDTQSVLEGCLARSMGMSGIDKCLA